MSTRSQSPQPSPSPRLRSRSRSHQRALNNAGRRGHTKSRLGCKTCKRRKVKCDEGRPSCGNCSKHGVVCDFVPLYSEEASPDELTLPFPPVINPHLNNLTDHHHNHHNHNGDAAAAAAPSSPGIDLLDLELLHNFTTYTYATLGSDQAMRNMMRTTAVKMAVGCEYLMRTILALSALHLAHFRKDKTDVYVNRALAHHQVASRQATALMGELKKEDCENLHLFTVMTVFVALGFPRNADYSLLLGTSVIPDWLPLLTTSEPILQVLKPREYRGRLKPIFSYGTARSRVVMSNDHPPPPWLLADLRTLVNETCRKPHFLPVYNHVIEDLRSMLALLVPHKQRDEEEYPSGGGGGSATAATTPSSQTATPAAGQLPPPSPPQLEAWDVLVWQWKFSDDFARLLRGPEPEQEAVAIYSHFFIMLKRLESQWWLEGWATHLMEKAWAVLDEEHRGWVQWPIEELGWVPP